MHRFQNVGNQSRGVFLRSQNHNDPSPEDGEIDPSEKSAWSQRPWVWFLIMLMIVVVMVQMAGPGAIGNSREVPASELLKQASRSNIQKLEEVELDVFVATLKAPIEVEVIEFTGKSLVETKSLRSNIPPALKENIFLVITAAQGEVVFLSTSAPAWQVIVGGLLPIIILVGFFWWMSNRVRRQMGGPGIFGKFASNQAKRFEKDEHSVSFEDVAGLKNVKKELSEIVEFLREPERFTKLGAKIPKGVLLVGPPGTGKTLLARAVAGEAEVPFFSISGSEFIELFVGVGASRVRELFEEAKRSAPCIIFIDEIDAVGRSRGAGLGGGHDEREQTLNQILSEMDGFESNQAVIVLAATNRPDVLDAALVRPGRFDRQVVVERPQKDGRRAILKVHSKDMPLDKNVDMELLARGTIGFSGADLENLANEAALMAARRGHNTITQGDFDRAKDKIQLGTLRDGAMSDREKELTAYHEAGHALVALLQPETDPVHSVTIVPRGRALGVTQQLPREEIHNYSRTYLRNRIAILLGGRAAEDLVFQEFTTGAQNDLEQATNLAERMICQWGMSEKMGPVSFKRSEEHVFLGRELGDSSGISEHTAMLIDEEIRAMLDDGYQRAMKILGESREQLELLTRELLEKEVLNDREIYDLMGIAVPPELAEMIQDSGEPPASRTAPEKKVDAAEDPKLPKEMDPGMLGLEGS
ncbi:MAG: ATP-dependent zinc metalloprotease FtsH [Planctomycetes bacterium]|nr:ATP-dependent zinc metalloprotease FtsH [Planctomycetota bacterium]